MFQQWDVGGWSCALPGSSLGQMGCCYHMTEIARAFLIGGQGLFFLALQRVVKWMNRMGGKAISEWMPAWISACVRTERKRESSFALASACHQYLTDAVFSVHKPQSASLELWVVYHLSCIVGFAQVWWLTLCPWWIWITIQLFLKSVYMWTIKKYNFTFPLRQKSILDHLCSLHFVSIVGILFFSVWTWKQSVCYSEENFRPLTWRKGHPCV